MASASDLVKDLSSVPSIVGGLGLSIASAQKAFDMEYLDSIERILAMAKVLLGGNARGANNTPVPIALKDEQKAFFLELLSKLAPSRYQFTETTLSVRMDLAQSLAFSGSVGLGFGIGAISINASFTLGYSYDYRAAAECKTVIHAYAADQTVFMTLLKQAATLDNKSLELPPRSDADQAIFDKKAAIFEKTTGQKALPVATIPVITSLDPATPQHGASVPIKVTAQGLLANFSVNIYDSSGNKTNLQATITNGTDTPFTLTVTNAPAGDFELEIVNPPDHASDHFKFKIV